MSEIKYELNHSAAHILAEALLKLYPHAKLAIGPAIAEGFYYDVDFGETSVSAKDFNKIKKTMQQIIKQKLVFSSQMKTKQELLTFYQNNPYKTEIIAELEGNDLQVVYTGAHFFDLCKGGHVHNTQEIKAFELLKISSAYWRGDANNPSLTRIYGVAFDNADDLENHLKILEELKLYDHRKLGHDLCIFSFDPLIGAGLPLWLENGTITKNLITKFVNQIQVAHGVDLVTTPILGSKELYQTSGHWDHYQENIFPPIALENREYVLRPMTCPHHIVLFQKQLWSYKMLPKIYGENAILHRYEHSGGLTGLERVRSMELIDNHAFLGADQITKFIETAYSMIKTAATGFGVKFSRIDLSLHDPDDKQKFINDPVMWSESESQLKAVLEDLKINYVPIIGEAAFYGPKIDFQMETIGRKMITVATIQLDFLLPKKFKLHYIDDHGNVQQPIMIHVGIIGTLERFIAILLETYKGNLPLWLSPKQIVIIPVNNETHVSAANELNKKLQSLNLRSFVDHSTERLAKKIRNAQIQKIPYQIVIGDKEVANLNEINYRKYGEDASVQISYDQFVKELIRLNQQPSVKL
ncbi:threonyl-tRNA synthetase [Mycoplasmoides fastidiosum]|uniref:Threonine--tRNA ligase n=1 Tax=Mycoplasmoides fastidiosum TaxID=92758 RepID=A0ABU0LYR0_9BACT|nr:threonine--tRNA ligase [Mycoplasmoides fastidiosum]MDQ0513735.1 threonyl-tRNA synthetase [Mycoplasmoides fastidiosum]UUD37844.1 threonine--tRNA ligase [Mycoplasmoides fastidiosum]